VVEESAVRLLERSVGHVATPAVDGYLRRSDECVGRSGWRRRSEPAL